jgi:hypothetical protein
MSIPGSDLTGEKEQKMAAPFTEAAGRKGKEKVS